jgi:hypothetical protein
MKGFLISFAVTLVAVVLLLLFWHSPAHSQGIGMIPVYCDRPATLIALLTGRHKETQRGDGQSGDRMIVRIYVSETATFSVIIINAEGQACLVAGGKDWKFEAVAVKGKPS